MKNRILIVTTLFLSSVSLTSRADDVRVSECICPAKLTSVTNADRDVKEW